jgi:hypothetical protein
MAHCIQTSCGNVEQNTISQSLRRAGVNIFASSGIADGGGSFCYLLYVRPDEFDRAVSCLDI